MFSSMEYDEYGEVINGIDTYKDIADRLDDEQSVIIGWTDEDFTHYDILFTFNCYKDGPLQRGLRGNELYVSIMSKCAFGFDVNNIEKSPGYIAEKLNITGKETTEKLAELINNVIKQLIILGH